MSLPPVLPRFIGITGRAGVGKSTLATSLQRNLPGCWIKSLADPIKGICHDVFGWSYDQLWGPSELVAQPARSQVGRLDAAQGPPNARTDGGEAMLGAVLAVIKGTAYRP